MSGVVEPEFGCDDISHLRGPSCGCCLWRLWQASNLLNTALAQHAASSLRLWFIHQVGGFLARL